MRRGIFLVSSLIFFTCGTTLAQGKPKPRAMPTASLPIEPFAPEDEVLNAKAPETTPDRVQSRTLVEMAPRTEAHEVAAAIRVQMTREGFGAQLRLLEFSNSWLSVSQNLRYFANDPTALLYERRYGLLLGLEVHPWRKLRVSPFLTLHAGGERFVRQPAREDLDLFLGEAAAGLELQLNRVASFSLQWVGTFYNGLKEPLFEEQKVQKLASSHTAVEVFFTMDWETTLL